MHINRWNSFQEMYLSQNEVNINNIWPTTTDRVSYHDKRTFAEYADTVHEKYLKDVFDGFYDDLHDQVSRVSLSIQNLGKQVESKFNEVHKHLSKFKEETEINEKFVR